MPQGEQMTIMVDQTLGHALTAIMAALILESVKVDRVRSETSVFYCDHNTLATSACNSDDHVYLKTAVQRFGIYFSKPGRVMVGADSRSANSGMRLWAEQSNLKLPMVYPILTNGC